MLESDGGSLRKQVFHKLENAIINREYLAGDNMNEIQLSQKLGVSRTPIREALMKLELEGLVRIVPNKGAVVIGVSEQDVTDIYAIRILTEGYASKLFTLHASEEAKKQLLNAVDLQEFYLIKGETERIWSLDSEFHTIIYEGCGNRSLGDMLTKYHNCIKRARDISYNARGRAEKSVNEHREICDAIVSGNANLAEKLTTKHLNNAQKNFLKEVEKKKS